MIILIIHIIIVSYEQNISLIFYVKDGSHVRLWHLFLLYSPETVHCSTKISTSLKNYLHIIIIWLFWRKRYKISNKMNKRLKNSRGRSSIILLMVPLSIAIYEVGLICLFVSNKRQDGWTDFMATHMTQEKVSGRSNLKD